MSLVAPMLLIAAAGAVLSFFLARRESRAIIEPLQEVDLDHPRRSYEHAYAEMVPMLERIESQRQELKRQMAVLADNDRMRRELLPISPMSSRPRLRQSQAMPSSLRTAWSRVRTIYAPLAAASTVRRAVWRRSSTISSRFRTWMSRACERWRGGAYWLHGAH